MSVVKIDNFCCTAISLFQDHNSFGRFPSAVNKVELLCRREFGQLNFYFLAHNFGGFYYLDTHELAVSVKICMDAGRGGFQILYSYNSADFYDVKSVKFQTSTILKLNWCSFTAPSEEILQPQCLSYSICVRKVVHQDLLSCSKNLQRSMRCRVLK